MAPEFIGKYRVLDEIAAGGQGAVYRAFDPSTGMIVAVKVPHAHLLSSEDGVERFRREASMIQALDHENVVKIFDVGESDGLYYIVLEFIPQSLDKLIELTGALPVERAVALAIGISEGIGQAHSQGIIHRDIKPQNVLLTPQGIPKVTDFGIARGEMLSTMTSIGAMMGTPSYMSPEQANGKRADSRSDVYSLGCLLYQLLSGEVPFSGDTPLAILRQHVDETPQPLKTKMPSVPSAVARCVEQAMSKEPSLRFDDGSIFAMALRRALPAAAAGIPEPTSGMPSSLEPSFNGRHFSDDTEPDEDELPVQEESEDEGPSEKDVPSSGPPIDPGSSADGTRIAFTSDREGNPSIYVMYTDGTGVTRLTSKNGRNQHPAWSPDGKRIAFTSVRNIRDRNFVTISVMNSDGTGVISLTSSGTDNDPAWSPDGKHIAFSSSRDGNSAIYVMNSDGTSENRLTSNGNNDQHPVWSPDGMRIAFCSKQDGIEEISIINSDGNHETRLTGSGGGRDQNPAWSPDGTRIAFSTARYGLKSRIYIMNSDGTGVTRLIGTANIDSGPAWSPDGTRIAFASDRYGSDSHIYVMNPDGTGVTRLTSDTVKDQHPAWSPPSVENAALEGLLRSDADRIGNIRV